MNRVWQAAVAATMTVAVATVPVAQAGAAPAVDMMARGARVALTPVSDVGTATLAKGDLFDLIVARDVVQDGYVVIPRGTPARARVTWRTGKGAFGKSAKMAFDLVDLLIDGRRVPISGHERIEGKGQTGLVIVAIVVGGLAAGSMVTGDDAFARRGNQWAARTEQPLGLAYAADPARGAAGLDPREAGRRAGQAAVLAAAMRD